MHLYNLTLQQPTGIGLTAIGNFSGSKQQEILVTRGAGSILELLRVDATTGKVQSLLTHHVMGVTRSIAAFRLTGSTKDYIIAGSDSGRITILEYNASKNALEKVHQETFGKSGVRRIVPGEYLAADPKGRAVLIGAIEKQKFVYILNRDAAAKLTISSPLEAHKSHNICHHVVGVDVGFENPLFAALEVDYSESDQDPTGEAFANTEKMLVFYELDLGLNHVIRKWSDPVDPRSNMLIAIPGGTDGPSGVLVCSEGFVTWRNQGFPAVRVPIPRRPGASAGRLIVSAVTHKMKNQFFIFAQTEDGDIFKITLRFPTRAEGPTGGVDTVVIKYYDTVPVSAGLCLLKSGFLFVASEFGNHVLYQIEDLGDDDDSQTEYLSNQFPQPVEDEDMDEDFDFGTVTFIPRGLRNLAPVDELESYAPLVDAKILNLTDEDAPQFYALCGKGGRSTFRMLKHGLEVSEMAVSELPGNPNAVWTVKATSQEEFDSYIVVSFVNATLVLSIGETVEEVTDTGFLGTTPTLAVTQLGDDALLQIYPQGLRHIRRDRRVNEWKTPGGRHIVKAACNERQVVIALTGGELVYFELDQAGHLNEFQERRDVGGAGITCLALAKVEQGRLRSRFLAVGCTDMTVRLLSLDPDTTLQPLGMQAVNAIPESLLLTDLFDTSQYADAATLYLYIGLQNGLLLRTVVDTVTAGLSDTRIRFLGARPVKLFKVSVGRSNAVLALSARPWLAYTYQGRNRLVPLTYEHLEWGSSFCSEQCPEGIVAISANTLRILTVEKLGVTFNQTSVPLKYTPRRFIYHPVARKFVIIEAEHNTRCPSERKLLEGPSAANGNGNGHAVAELPPEQFGLPRAEAGKWGSCIRLLDPFSGFETTHVLELDDNEAAFCVTIAVFAANPTEALVVVGTGKDVVLSPRTCSSGFIRLYRIVDEGRRLELLHATALEDVPYAVCAFQGRLLVGMGRILRIYDLGKKKLLRKCENKHIPQAVVNLHTQGDRIIIGDIQESVHFAMYHHNENRITIFADDTIPRWTTCTTMTDYDTIAGGDKFGNVWMVRLPTEVSTDLEDDPTGNKLIYEKPYLQGAPFKLQHLCEMFVGDTVTSIGKATLTTGAREVLAYTTFFGSIGMLVPFVSKEDVDFFQNLEMHMRVTAPPLLGRNHIAYRSSYVTVRNVVDGDLCEQFNLLPLDKKNEIAEQLDRTVAEVARKLEEIRSRNAF
ncbi:CPSF A subunit region-domain-containing protein [Hyaloraphidium curvatum]|nr:CPSF A subunit region-domain-containing protein [Hyaloraphidium curvatum]